MSRLVVIAVLAGCYAPKVEQGSPCNDLSPCPTSLACIGERCLPPGSPPLDDAGADATIAACTPTGPEICGDGIDQDCVAGDAVCLSNDQAAGATDVTIGGTWHIDLALQTDDLASVAATGCNADGGRDAFYQVTLTTPEVYAFDTFGSGFDTSLRIFPGVACPAVTGAMTPGACSDDVCGHGESQVGVALPVGPTCIVLDQNQNQATGKAVLHVTRGHRTGPAVPTSGMIHGDTCTGADLSDSGCGEDGAKDLAYWFLACPGQTTTLDANTCGPLAETNYDTVIAIHDSTGGERICDDDDDAAHGGKSCNRKDDTSVLAGTVVAGPGLFWLVIDGFAADCGKFRVDTKLR